MDILDQFEMVKTIRDLPNETMAEIFGYMTHTEKLISRLVCKDWNDITSSILIKTSHLVLKCRDSNLVALNSSVQWTKIRISDYGSSLLSTEFRDCVTTLQLDISGVQVELSDYKKLLPEFPKLETLHINIDESISNSNQVHTKQKETRISKLHFEECVGRLKNLKITFPFNNYATLTKILDEFCTEKMSLNKLIIIERVTEILIPATGDSTEMFFHINRIVDQSNGTLKHLELDFYSKTLRSNMFPDLVSKFCSVEGLQLTSSLIRHDAIQENIDRDFLIHQEFLKKQAGSGMLKNIALPWCNDASLCQEFMNAMPRDIDSMMNICKEHVTEEFPTIFTKLKSFSSCKDQNSTVRIMFERNFRNIRRHQFNSIEYNDAFDPRGVLFVYQRTNNEPSVTTACSRFGGRIPASSLNVLNKWKYLRVLEFENCNIADYGVIGIVKDDPRIKELIITKRLYFNPAFVPEEDMIENTLSRLEMLEKVILTGTMITDAGIVLGLKFGPKLKHLVFGSKSGEVTDMGLQCLGANNPGLESFDGSFNSENITLVGTEAFKKRLYMVEFTQQFKLVNKPVP